MPAQLARGVRSCDLPGTVRIEDKLMGSGLPCVVLGISLYDAAVFDPIRKLRPLRAMILTF
jgi:hypothetical protein